MIIVDFSGIAIAPIAQKYVAVDDVDLFRHMVLNSLRMYRQKFKKYGELVIVADGGGNWRKDVYPEYKGKRKTNRDASPIDWSTAWETITTVLNELKENMPYKIIHQWGCEADDAIAELVMHTQTFGNWEDVMIVSSDHDFIQLQKYDNVKQFSTVTKKMVKNDNPRLYQAEHFIRGCSGDGVPNCLSDDDALINPDKRQTVLSAKKKAALLDDPKALGEDVYRNYQRNVAMINLTENTKCPENVRNEIINTFEKYDTPDKSKVFPYLVAKNCRRLLEDVMEFIN